MILKADVKEKMMTKKFLYNFFVCDKGFKGFVCGRGSFLINAEGVVRKIWGQ